MSITHIARIKQLDQQIKSVNTLLKNGEHNAAGLSLWIKLGPNTETNMSKVLTVETCENTTAILEIIRCSLFTSRNMQMSLAKKLLKELNDFVCDEELSQKENPATGS